MYVVHVLGLRNQFKYLVPWQNYCIFLIKCNEYLCKMARSDPCGFQNLAISFLKIVNYMKL